MKAKTAVLYALKHQGEERELVRIDRAEMQNRYMSDVVRCLVPWRTEMDLAN
jgi:hypothetical protein